MQNLALDGAESEFIPLSRRFSNITPCVTSHASHSSQTTFTEMGPCYSNRSMNPESGNNNTDTLFTPQIHIEEDSDVTPESDDEPVWVLREDIQKLQQQKLVTPPKKDNLLAPPRAPFLMSTTAPSGGACGSNNNKSQKDRKRSNSNTTAKQDSLSDLVFQICRKEQALISRREMVVEWQTIATVIDRLLFWVFFMGTIVAYIVILICIPYTKPTHSEDVLPMHTLNSHHNVI